MFRALLGSKGDAKRLDPPNDRSDAAVPSDAAAASFAAHVVTPHEEAASVAKAGALGLDPAAADSIGRLANAVAEAFARGRDPVFTIRFNDPTALSEGALLVREAGGALTVRLEGVTAAALALSPRALEDGLRAALERRRVRLGRLEWGAPARTRVSR